ncbi:MAG: hypothetical protein ACI8S6_003704 [Myxococcota bacterium]|jgi:hypothetical protein
MEKGDERYMKRLQRRLSRRQGPRPGVVPSKRWIKARDALQHFHAQLRRRRLDAIHKPTVAAPMKREPRKAEQIPLF